MKRKIAMLLAIIMMVNMMPPINVFGATNQRIGGEKYDFIARTYGIAFGADSPTPDTEKAPPMIRDQGGAQWDISNSTGNYNNGLYRFTYYVFKDKTHRIEVDLEVGKGISGVAQPTKTTVGVKIYEENSTTPKSVQYTQLNAKTPSTTELDEFKIELNLAGMAEDKELELQVGNYSVLKLQIKKGIVQLTTTGIENGYITPYKLQVAEDYKENNLTTGVTIDLFKGIDGFKVSPQHLYVEGGILDTKPSLTYKDDVPGAKPGIKVEFKLPQIIENGKFVKMSGVGSEYVTLNLREEFIVPGGNAPMPKQISFKLQDGASIYDDDKINTSEPSIGNVNVKDEIVSLYLVNDKEQLQVSSVVAWSDLKPGMLMQTLVTLKDGKFANLFPKTFRPINLGYTYIYYTARKIEGGDIAFEITPYQINGPVTYQLHYRPNGTGSDWIPGPSVYYPNGSSPDKKLTLTTKAARTSYKITVTTGGKDNEIYTYESQELQYDPTGEATPPPLPELLSIENVYVVPDGKEPQTQQPPAIGFDLDFRAPSTQELEVFLKDKGAIYYELYLHNGENTVPTLIKVFKASLKKNATGKDEVALESYAGASEKGIYNTRQDIFSVQNIQLKKNGRSGWESLEIVPQNYLNGVDYPSTINSSHTLPYKVPGTYYLSMRAVADSGNKEGVTPAGLAISETSNLKSFSLDMVNEVIPTAKTIDSVSASVNDEIAQRILFNHVDLSRYIRFMLDPVGLALKGNRTNRSYEVYLYQDKDMVEGDFKDATALKKNTQGNFNVSKEELELIRTGKHALRMDYTSSVNDPNQMGEVVISGLEPNQVYYTQIRVRLDIEGESIEKQEYSLLSKTHSFTTDTKPLPPTPDEQIPPAPTKFFIDQMMSSTAVKLGWEPPNLEESQKADVFYEFIRSAEVEIPVKNLGRENRLIDIVKGNSNYKAFKTYAPREQKPYVHTYNGTEFVPLVPEQLAVNLRLMDQTLAPNTIYYYYARTVQQIQGKDVASEWIMIPVTTIPVEKPIKLTIEAKSSYNYNPKNETVISFWAPIPPGGKVPEEYSFDIAVKGEKDEDFRLDYKVTQIKEEPVDTFYKKYVYRIEGLKPGSRYDIKVRVKDKTKPRPEGGDYPSSLYSEKVVCRTDFDDEDQEKDEAFEEYLKKYDQETEKLKRQVYWEVGDDKYRGVYKYRESYLESEIKMKNTYELVSDSGDSQGYYYLPASTFKLAGQNKTMFKIQLQDTTLHLRPNTLSDKNKDVIEAISRIDDKKIKDYYVGVEVLIYSSTQSIYGGVPVSPEITIEMELVYSEEEDRFVEDEIMEDLMMLIAKGRLNVIDQLEKEVDKGRIQEERLDAIIQKELSTIQNKHKICVKSTMKDITDKEVYVSDIDQSFLLTQKIQKSGVEAYYSRNGWEKVYLMQTNGGYSIEGAKLGTYIFTGKTSQVGDSVGAPGASDLVSKYQLTDFFTLSPERLNWYVTKSQAYGSVARVLGASRGVDYVEYLKQRGIQDVNRIGMEKAMRQDEVIYLVMQAYEKINNKSVQQIVIRNKQSVSNIGTFQPKYRQYVYASVELGMIMPSGQKISPSEGVTTRLFLQMLTNIVTK